MKILAICGSPRKGNTEAMLREILRGAEQADTDTELVLLRELDIKHCNGCVTCEQTKFCNIKDDMQGLYRKIFKSDVLVLGSPNYFNNVTGLMKDFIDRMCPYYRENKMIMGKKAVIISVGGEEAESSGDALKEFCDICKMNVIGILKAKAYDAGKISENKKKMQECFELGQKLAKL